MKFKATKKEMRNGYHRIIGTGYCNMAYMLYYEKEVAYSTRAEGWACDYHDIDGVLISTGYAPLNSKNVKEVDYDTRQKYETQAQEIVLGSGTWEEKKEKVRQVLKSFIALVTEQGGLKNEN